MLLIALTIQYEDGTEAKVTAKAANLMAFERQFNEPMAVFADSAKLRLEWILWLAWHTCSREKLTPLDFDAWVDTVGGIVVGDAGK